MRTIWGIRHLRYYWLRYRVDRFAAYCRDELGLGMGVPNPSDLAVLDAVWRGEQ